MALRVTNVVSPGLGHIKVGRNKTSKARCSGSAQTLLLEGIHPFSWSSGSQWWGIWLPRRTYGNIWRYRSFHKRAGVAAGIGWEEPWDITECPAVPHNDAATNVSSAKEETLRRGPEVLNSVMYKNAWQGRALKIPGAWGA